MKGNTVMTISLFDLWMCCPKPSLHIRLILAIRVIGGNVQTHTNVIFKKSHAARQNQHDSYVFLTIHCRNFVGTVLSLSEFCRGGWSGQLPVSHALLGYSDEVRILPKSFINSTFLALIGLWQQQDGITCQQVWYLSVTINTLECRFLGLTI